MKMNENFLKKIERYAPVIFEKFEKKERAETLAKRKEKAAELARIQAEMDRAVRTHLAEKTKAETAVKQAEAAVQIEKEMLLAVKRNLANARTRGETQAARLRNALIETADPQIDDAIVFFQKKLDWLRKPGRISSNAGGSASNLISWKKDVKAETNRPAVLAALKYCQAAITGKKLTLLMVQYCPPRLLRIS